MLRYSAATHNHLPEPFMTFLKLYAIAVPVFFVIDLIWLGIVAQAFYQDQIGQLLKPNVNWWAAIVFYLLFVAGIIVFVVQPALEKESWKTAVILGGFFGFICYATYDLTNLAVAKDWPLTVTIVDLIWGTVLCSMVSSITFVIARYFHV